MYVIRIEGFRDLDFREFRAVQFFGTRVPQIIGEVFFRAGEVQRYTIRYRAASSDGDAITILLPAERLDEDRCRAAEARMLNSLRTFERARPAVHFEQLPQRRAAR